jgi:hypothetical protein
MFFNFIRRYTGIKIIYFYDDIYLKTELEQKELFFILISVDSVNFLKIFYYD